MAMALYHTDIPSVPLIVYKYYSSTPILGEKKTWNASIIIKHFIKYSFKIKKT